MGKRILSAVIIEDEQKSLDLLRDLIDSGGQAKVTGATSNPEEAADLIQEIKPDVVFLDIKMPGKSGFEVLDELSGLKTVDPVIIFTTAYDEFTVRAFEYAAFDYLLKPIDPERLETALTRCADRRKNGYVSEPALLKEVLNKLVFRNVSGIVIIDPADIVYVEAEGNYSSFRLGDGKKETVTVSIGKVEEQLSPGMFFRTGRTFIINLKFLRKINSKKRECILYAGGQECRCDISHDKIKILLGRLKNS